MGPLKTRRTIAALLLLAAAGLAPAARAADDFYLARLQEGRLALQTGRAAEAADLLRIAVFGLLDNPPALTEGVVWLGIAQERLGRAADVDATLRRFLEAEKRFAGYGRIALPAEARAEFDAVLVKRLPPEALLSLPGLARLVETEEQKIAKMPPAERARAMAAKAKAEPGNVKWPLALGALALEQGQPKEAVRQAGLALAIDGGSTEARKIRARALTSRREYSAALLDLTLLPPGIVEADAALQADFFVALAAAKRWEEARSAAKGLKPEAAARPDVAAALAKLPPEPGVAPAGDAAAPAAEAAAAVAAPAVAAAATEVPPVVVAPPAPKGPSVDEVRAKVRELTAAGKADAARDLAVGALAARPDDRELKKVVLEAACMAKDWPRVTAQAAALQPFAAGEEPSMFYAAVGLYETGRRAEARPLLERARPAIAATPFVNYYVERLLR